ncbi:hypothetical protein SNOG_08554 [Parastagonospora nodorum SN15]|uniref:Uncharacterized protein n=1 Tax=Phaeosphaeria nodorum (strain SN15 / ATCC MYA-4574 / FGSC 10173) TaxID=321614 RepID=Q0UI60_PHANO|nr:hypothetical protein SNOG_08554 [Parastagonospora nodorum SN15]EAT83722.1 hypothetical protein SNOG_08554 [Parastagonospora nodorum SN15]
MTISWEPFSLFLVSDYLQWYDSQLLSQMFDYFLIQYGADVSSKSLRGQGALDLVLRSGPRFPNRWWYERVRQQLLAKLGLLLEAGCDPRIKLRFSKTDVEPREWCWWKALDTEKKRRSLLPPQETQHLPPLP